MRSSGGRRLAAVIVASAAALAAVVTGVSLGARAMTRAQVPDLPDLAATRVRGSPATVGPGGSLTVRDRVVNKGRAPAGKSTVGYYLSRIKWSARVRIGGRVISSLAPGKTSSARRSFRLPATIAAGAYSLVACADDHLRVKESNETNNCAAFGPIKVVPRDRVAPTSKASAPQLTNSAVISVAYTADGTGSRLKLVELWAREPAATSFSKVEADTSPAPSGHQFAYHATGGDGTYAFFTRAYDAAGNVQATPAAPDATTTLDTAAPRVTIVQPGQGATTDLMTFSGAAGTAAGDSRTVTLEIYQGTHATGAALQSPNTTVMSGSWTATASPLLGAGTYTAKIVQQDAAGNVGTQTSTFHVPVTLLAAGDIAPGTDPDPNAHAATAALIVLRSGTVAPLGDNAYEDGLLTEYTSWYDPTWGAFKSRTKPVPGNHEYHSQTDAAGYFDYFDGSGNTTGRAGDRGTGYYSYDLGNWHIVALNSNSDCTTISCAAGQAQEQWLRADLAMHTTQCILAYWHHPLVSSSAGDQDLAVRPLFRALYENHADIVVNGHQHNYERFGLQDSLGNADSNGVREFVVGTGGHSHRAFAGAFAANSEAHDDQDFGILDLTLNASSYDWRFVSTSGAVLDRGSRDCHNSQP